jgi:hypothetical protein
MLWISDDAVSGLLAILFDSLLREIQIISILGKSAMDSTAGSLANSGTIAFRFEL